MKTKVKYEYVMFQCVAGSDNLRGLAIQAIFAQGRGQGKIAWDSNAEFSADVVSSCNVRGVEIATYRGRFKLVEKLHVYEIREGNGNDGEYYRGRIESPNAFEALRMASRSRMIFRPWDVKIGDMLGDDQNAYLISYVAPIFGDSARWCASANMISE